MRIFRLLTSIAIFSFILTACNTNQPQQTSTAPQPYPADATVAEDDYWAKDNFDLQRVGDLLERSDSPEEFEGYLNDDDGINNLDLNGDGYADYISVDEFDDRDSNSRGLSLFTRFGPDLIQEIATILFYRDRPDYPGSRIFLAGNPQIYGDNYYYETNWLDRSLSLASFLFNDHDPYRSPYYYDNYPSGYRVYEVVDTPIYRTRITDLYPQPVFVQTTAVPTYISSVKIKSPHNGKWMDKIHAKLAKPTKEQTEFIKNNPSRRQFAKQNKKDDGISGDKPGRDDPPRSDRGDERGNPARDERGAQRGNPDKPAAPKPDRPDVKVAKPDNPGKGQDKAPGGPPKADNPGKGGGGDKGGGKGKKP